HHGAQKSRTTGRSRDPSTTRSWKFSGVISTTQGESAMGAGLRGWVRDRVCTATPPVTPWSPRGGPPLGAAPTAPRFGNGVRGPPSLRSVRPTLRRRATKTGVLVGWAGPAEGGEAHAPALIGSGPPSGAARPLKRPDPPSDSLAIRGRSG